MDDDRGRKGSGTFGHERVQCEVAIGSLRKDNIVERSRVGEYGGEKESERESFHALLHSSYVQKALLTLLFSIVLLPNTVNAAAKLTGAANAGRTDSQISRVTSGCD